MEIHSLKGETSDIILNAVVNSVNELNVTDFKVLLFTGDSKVVNFGETKQHGKKNALSELRKPVEHECTRIWL